MRRRTWALATALALALSLAPLTALASPITEGGGQPRVEANAQSGTLETVYVTQLGNDANSGATSDEGVSTLTKALELVAEDGTIVVGRTLYLTEYLEGAQTIEVGAVTIERAEDFEKTLLQPNGCTLVLNGTTIDGKNLPTSNSGQLIHVQSGECIINEGTRIVNNTSCAIQVGGGTGTASPTLTMNGGEISSNSNLLDTDQYATAGAIYLYGGVLNLRGGTISNNQGHLAGAICAYGRGTVNLSGTTISGNTSETDAGALYIAGNQSEGMTLNMTGGSITDNTCSEGWSAGGIGAYYFGSPTILNISGGTIADNTISDGTAGDAISVWTNDYGNDPSAGPELSFSGSPTIGGTVYFMDGPDGMPYDAVTIQDGFAPTSPVSFASNYGFSIDTPTGIVFSPGASTENLASQVAFPDTMSNRGLAPAVNDEGEVIVIQMVRVNFNSANNQENYARHYVMPGALIDPALAPAESSLDAPVGYHLAGWSRYPGNLGLWDFSEDLTPSDAASMTLLATWALDAPTATVGGTTTVHVGTNIRLTAVATHPLEDVTYSYQWYRDGEKIDGSRGRTLTVTEPGDYAVEIVAHDGDDVSDATMSEAVTCSFEDHTPAASWTYGATSHWHECTVCGTNLDAATHVADDVWHTDGTSHWHECVTCGARLDVAAHEAGSAWESNDVQHWHLCATCGAAVGSQPHDWGDWAVTDSATALESGSRERTCSTCGLKQTEVIPPSNVETLRMMRFYNPWTGEHLYTSSEAECKALESQGWEPEGIGWLAPSASTTPVYRLYNPYVLGGDHHYTMSVDERDALVAAGWRYEGVGWYSAEGEDAVELHRLYNPNATTGTHHYTTDVAERDALVDAGWRYEGIAWKGAAS